MTSRNGARPAWLGQDAGREGRQEAGAERPAEARARKRGGTIQVKKPHPPQLEPHLNEFKKKTTHFTFKIHSFLDLIAAKEQRRPRPLGRTVTQGYGAKGSRVRTCRRDQRSRNPPNRRTRVQEKAQREAPERKS